MARPAEKLRAQFTIDPKDPDFRRLRAVCEPGNPWRCLIATMGSVELGRRMTVRLDHEKGTGVLGVTFGDSRYERPMTSDEIEFARAFDLGKRMRKPLEVRVDLTDGSWKAKPKGRVGGRPNGPRNAPQHLKTIRARQLAAIRARMTPETA